MKGALTDTPTYRFDANGNLVAEEGETDEARSTRESIILYAEGFSANHPADVAASNDPEIPDVPPEQEEGVEGETNEQRQAREQRTQIRQEAWERKREATRGSQQGEAQQGEMGKQHPKNLPLVANDSNNPRYAEPTEQDQRTDDDNEEVSEDDDENDPEAARGPKTAGESIQERRERERKEREAARNKRHR